MSVFTEGCCHLDSATGAVRPPAEIVFTEGIGSDLTVLVRRDSDLVAILRDKYEALAGVLDERSRRRWAAVEAMSLGYGGESLVAAATGISRPTIRAGKAELASGEDLGDRIRRPGAGRPSLEEKQPGIRDAWARLVEPLTRGDAESPRGWTTKSSEKFAAAVAPGVLVSAGPPSAPTHRGSAAGGPVDTRRPGVTAAMDDQEQGEVLRGIAGA